MILQDIGFVYKKYENSYYVMTNKNGKIIIKNSFFTNKYPSMRSFFFIFYEYEKAKIEYMQQLNKKNILVNEIELEYIVPYEKINYFSNILIYIFDYHFLFGMTFDFKFIDCLINLYKNKYDEISTIIMIYDIICIVESEEPLLREEFLEKNKNGKIEHIKNMLLIKQPYHLNKIQSIFFDKSNQ